MDTTTDFTALLDKAQALVIKSKQATSRANERGTKGRCNAAGNALVAAARALQAAALAAEQDDVKKDLYRQGHDCMRRAQTMYARSK